MPTDQTADVTALADVFETVVRLALAPLQARVRALEAVELPTLRAELAELGAKAAQPGPQGPQGAAGLAEGYRVEYDGERTLTQYWKEGGVEVAHPLRLPTLIYRGVFVSGRLYERGDCVTANGSLWHCNADTETRPGDGAGAWTLAVKHGRDAMGVR